jgi:hypothetical protein
VSLQAVIAMDGVYAENAGAIFSHLRLNFQSPENHSGIAPAFLYYNTSMYLYDS